MTKLAFAAAVLVASASTHGWALGPRPGCVPRGKGQAFTAILCKTDDDGRHWRPVFDARAAALPEPTTSRWLQIGSRSFAATSAKDAIFSVAWQQYDAYRQVVAYGHLEYWTRDGGRHWYRTTALAGLDRIASLAVGYEHDHAVVYAQQPGGAVYRLDGWPPTAAVVCAGRWRGVSAWPAYPRNVCTGGPQDAGMSAERIGRTGGERACRLSRPALHSNGNLRFPLELPLPSSSSRRRCAEI